ncbi:MAG: tyrosine--tRNA ligase [bacterium]|nr:tyrosine--tRNA ligase [bacterium]
MKKRELKQEEVLSRQVAEILPAKKGLETLMEKRKIRLYLGVDPTSPSLHLGHAVLFRKLRQFQDLGHEVILLFGTFTARIGDPSGRDQTRQPLSEKEINENIRTYRRQASLVLDMKCLRIEKNHVWLSKMSIQDTQKLASLVTVSHLWERDMFQERKKRGQPVWLNEMFYPLLQGYDSVALDVDLEVGGTDQTFNMLVGRELQRAYHNKEKYILTMPLLLGPDGRKMSKSLGNTINLLDEPKEMYGKIMTLRDELVEQYFELATDVEQKEIIRLKKEFSPRDLKARLAREIVTIYHTEAKAQQAEKEFVRIFQKKQLPSHIKKAKSSHPGPLPLYKAIGELFSVSGAEAKRVIEQGGVKIDGAVKKDPGLVFQLRSGMIVQVGKRRVLQIM